MNQTNRLKAIQEDVLAAGSILQNNESLILTEMLADKDAAAELHQLAADLFSLVDAMLDSARRTNKAR